MDGHAALLDGLMDELGRLLGASPELAQQLDELDLDQAVELGRRAAGAALAPLAWALAVGDRRDVRWATEFLGVSRQALYKRLRTGSALGVPGRGTTWFPAWQFDLELRIIRSVVGDIVRVFRQADPDVDPQVIAAWANKTNRLLGGATPAEWVAGGRDDAKVVAAARRAARGLAA